MARTVKSIKELVSLSELRTVKIFEASAKRRDGFDLEGVPVDDGNTDLHVRQEVGDKHLEFRCRIELNAPKAIIVADAAAVFTLSEEIEVPSDEILGEFARIAGLPVVLPYVRVTLQQVARQVGVAGPLLKHYWTQDYKNSLPGLEGSTTLSEGVLDKPAEDQTPLLDNSETV